MKSSHNTHIRLHDSNDATQSQGPCIVIMLHSTMEQVVIMLHSTMEQVVIMLHSTMEQVVMMIHMYSLT